MGEIGGNDYNYAFFVGGSIKELRAVVPLVVDAITRATGVSSIVTALAFTSRGSNFVKWPNL